MTKKLIFADYNNQRLIYSDGTIDFKKPHSCYKNHDAYINHHRKIDEILTKAELDSYQRDEWLQDGVEDDMRREAQDYIDSVGYVGDVMIHEWL